MGNLESCINLPTSFWYVEGNWITHKRATGGFKVFSLGGDMVLPPELEENIWRFCQYWFCSHANIEYLFLLVMQLGPVHPEMRKKPVFFISVLNDKLNSNIFGSISAGLCERRIGKCSLRAHTHSSGVCIGLYTCMPPPEGARASAIELSMWAVQFHWPTRFVYFSEITENACV